MAEEYVVAEGERDPIAANKAASDDKSFGEAARGVLRGKAYGYSEHGSVTEETAEQGLVLRRRNDENVSYPRHHQRRQRVVDHRFVVDRQQLLGEGYGERIESCSRAAGEDDPFHRADPLIPQKARCLFMP